MSNLRDADDLTRDPQDEKPDSALEFLDVPTKTNDAASLRAKAISDKGKALKEENDLREILNTQAGIRFLAKVLAEVCYIDETPFNPSNSIMSNIAGRRQVGMTIKAMVRDVDFELWVRVDREIEARRAKPKTSKPKI